MKNFFGYLFVSLSAVALLFSSCDKEYNTRVCESPVTVVCASFPMDSTKVNVRLVNKTGYPICALKATYETTSGEIIQYGRFDTEEISCYSTYPKTSVKVFPLVEFDLGTRHYVIADTLSSTAYPYGDFVIETEGFYTFNVLIADSLNSDTCRTFLQREF